MRRVVLLTAVMWCFLAVGSSASAYPERVRELWRSPTGRPDGMSVNAADESVWVAAATSVVHRADDGTVLSETGGFCCAYAVSVNSADGSCWVGDIGADAVVHLADDGTELWRGSAPGGAWSVSVNSADGSCWAATLYTGVLHLAADGTELSHSSTVGAGSVSVNPTDGSCWVADYGNWEVAHLSASGAEIWHGYLGSSLAPSEVAVNPVDGSCWVAATVHYVTSLALEGASSLGFSTAVVHLAADGHELWRKWGLARISPGSVNPVDGSCWTVDAGVFDQASGTYLVDPAVVHLAADGQELWRGGSGLLWPTAVAVDPVDGSCWAASSAYEWIAHLSVSGTKLWQTQSYASALSVSANPTDDSCWVGLQHEVAHLGADGALLSTSPDFSYVRSVSANSADGSCWAADGSGDDVVHLSSTGAESWQGGGFQCTRSVAVNPTDGSCWVAARGGVNAVVHLSVEGDQLWQSEYLTCPAAVSVNPGDGSCWVADGAHWGAYGELIPGRVLHVSEAGAELWRGEQYGDPTSVSVNPSDGSCWVALWVWQGTEQLGGAVVHLAVDGTELSRSEAFENPVSLSVNASDGSCWVADVQDWDGSHYTSGALVHLSASGDELWRSDPAAVTAVSANSADGSCWAVMDKHLVHLQASRSPFTDIPGDFWAYDEIQACYDAHIVTGYPDGTFRPKQIVTRDLMAAYLARARFGGDELVPTGPATASFSDVPPSYGFYRHIEYCHDQGMVMGYKDGTYQPTWGVNRGQMAAFLARAMCGGDDFVPTGPATASFTDVPLDFGFFRYIEYIYAAGITTGYGDATYHPEWACSRDQMAVFVARAFRLLP